MAPQSSEEPAATSAEPAGAGAISKVLVVIAMQTEALPLVTRFQLVEAAADESMSGAAVAYVADLFSIPAIFVKAVTDIVDGEKPTAEEFLQNLISVTMALDQAVLQVVDFISGKCISDL